MPYFHNTSEEIQKLATYAAKSFQLLDGFAPRLLDRGSASRPHWGHSPRPSAYSPSAFYFPPNLGCLDKTQRPTNSVKALSRTQKSQTEKLPNGHPFLIYQLLRATRYMLAIQLSKININRSIKSKLLCYMKTETRNIIVHN